MPQRLVALACLLGLAAGCALFRGPGTLLVQANAAFDRRDAEGAYALAKQIRLAYPASPESREAFPIAAYAWKFLYHQHRYSAPDSAWVTAEPAFLFDWLATFFASGSPQQAAEVMFVGLPYGVLRDFEDFARSRPELAPWRLEAQDDNGIIQGVAVERAEARAP